MRGLCVVIAENNMHALCVVITEIYMRALCVIIVEIDMFQYELYKCSMCHYR